MLWLAVSDSESLRFVIPGQPPGINSTLTTPNKCDQMGSHLFGVAVDATPLQALVVPDMISFSTWDMGTAARRKINNQLVNGQMIPNDGVNTLSQIRSQNG